MECDVLTGRPMPVARVIQTAAPISAATIIIGARPPSAKGASWTMPPARRADTAPPASTAPATPATATSASPAAVRWPRPDRRTQ